MIGGQEKKMMMVERFSLNFLLRLNNDFIAKFVLLFVRTKIIILTKNKMLPVSGRRRPRDGKLLANFTTYHQVLES